MRFRDFLYNEGKYKGLRRMFDKAQPHTPAYVRQKMYNQMIAPGMTDALAGNEENLKAQQTAPASNKNIATVTQNKFSTIAADKLDVDPMSTIAAIQTTDQHPSTHEVPPYRDPKTLPSAIMGDPHQNPILNARFNPKPQQVTLTPADLEDKSLARLRVIRFGMKPSKKVNRDELRYTIQTQIADERGEGNNEPIILVRMNNGKYKLADGYHRASVLFLKGAPKADIPWIQQGDFSYVNFDSWRPVTMMAYVGFPRNTNPVEMPSPPAPHAVMPNYFTPQGEPAATIAAISPSD
jgi:hypothetical protein